MTRRLTLIGVLGVCAIVAVVLAIAGSGGDANLVSGSAIAEAADVTAKVPGASMTMDITMEIDGLDHPISAHMTGVSERRGRTAHMTGEYLNMPKEVPGAGADGRVPIESIFVQPRVYMKSPIFGSQLPDGKEWLGYDVAKAGQELGIGDPSQFNQSSDPMESLKSLRAISDRVEQLGTEDVRGVHTTHYRATVELRRIPETLPADQRDSASKSIARLTELIGTDSYPVEIWIDGHHLVRRMMLTMTMKIPRSDKRMRMDMAFEMFDFGPKPVTKAPPKEDVYDATKLAGRTP